jgi:collagenase-like PrtC family protease
MSEVWAFGRLPLALSGRCYHARVHGLSKDGCQFVCSEDPDGLVVETLDGEPFLAINGVQTLSFTHCSLLTDLDCLRQSGVTSFRISPHRCDVVSLAAIFRGVLDRRLEGGEASQRLAALLPQGKFSNGFLAGSCGAEFDLSRQAVALRPAMR